MFLSSYAWVDSGYKYMRQTTVALGIISHISYVLVDSGSGCRLTPLRAVGAKSFFGGPAQVQGRGQLSVSRPHN